MSKMNSFSFIEDAYRESVEWAQSLLQLPTNQLVILDTETTGLTSTDQVLQIGVIDGAGNVMINNQLIRPTCEISPEAQAVHGISMEMVQNAPTLDEFTPTLREVFRDKRKIVIYNANFDIRLIAQSLNIKQQILIDQFFGIAPICAMLRYAEYVGEFNQHHGNFRWQRLPNGAHDAVGDCMATLNLIQRMARNGLE